MSKRIFLLLSVFAIIISVINCKAHTFAIINTSSSGNLNIVAAHDYGHPYSINLNKDTNNKNKNAIRIKAWDDASAALFPSVTIPIPAGRKYNNPFLLGYCSPTFFVWFSNLNLRGPPQN